MSKSLGIEATPVRCSPVVREPLTSEQSAQAAAVFKALADPVRLQLFSLIASHDGGQACVCDISPAVDVSQPTISHHLKVLRTAGLLESERRGSWVHYRVVPAALDVVAAIVAPLTGKALA
ncbi:metalloregulator ArsR/SmtB family transcription factor [Gordonia aichiensis]|uniref:metalloregulator ArsR/SmtB family transcription factor n=2 Tax=Gordonia TaxID=2053 RepID=UPI003263F17A